MSATNAADVIALKAQAMPETTGVSEPLLMSHDPIGAGASETQAVNPSVAADDTASKDTAGTIKQGFMVFRIFDLEHEFYDEFGAIMQAQSSCD